VPCNSLPLQPQHTKRIKESHVISAMKFKGTQKHEGQQIETIVVVSTNTLHCAKKRCTHNENPVGPLRVGSRIMCCHYLNSHNNTWQGDKSRHRNIRCFSEISVRMWRAFSASTASIFCNIILALPVSDAEVNPPECFYVKGKWRVAKGAAARDLQWH